MDQYDLVVDIGFVQYGKLADGRWAMGDGRWAMADGANGRWQEGEVRKRVVQNGGGGGCY